VTTHARASLAVTVRRHLPAAICPPPSPAAISRRDLPPRSPAAISRRHLPPRSARRDLPAATSRLPSAHHHMAIAAAGHPAAGATNDRRGAEGGLWCDCRSTAINTQDRRGAEDELVCGCRSTAIKVAVNQPGGCGAACRSTAIKVEIAVERRMNWCVGAAPPRSTLKIAVDQPAQHVGAVVLENIPTRSSRCRRPQRGVP
jgi:hypothetical protein